jgi:hypothetical protein
MHCYLKQRIPTTVLQHELHLFETAGPTLAHPHETAFFDTEKSAVKLRL